MQLFAVASAAALFVSTVAAGEFNHNSTCDDNLPKVRVFNRCPYKVHLWSILKGQGCPAEEGAVIETGDFYQENFRTDAVGGVSLKISKEKRCKGVDCTQLEYFIDGSESYGGNYLDVSYVDCQGKLCPTAKEGFYLKSGNQDGQFMANTLNEICPIFSCSNFDECSKVAYVLPHDRQTKFCNTEANLDFYMCGSEPPEEGSTYQPPEEDNTYQPPVVQEPKPSTSEKKQEQPAPTSEKKQEQPAPTSAHEEKPAYTKPEVEEAAVTPPPVKEDKPKNVKTEVVYVTKYEYVNAKRHAHGHRHQHFRA